jgi:crossover junction endodeoxyribonuclease RuvC
MGMDAIVCGVDPGLQTTGYAVVRYSCGEPTIVDAGVCRFDPQRPLAERLAQVDADVAAILDEHHPDRVAVESLYAHYKHPRTAILMGHARGVILAAAARRGIEVSSYGATRVKRYVTGRGQASKPQVQRAIQHMLGLSDLPEPDDVADALAIALCCGSELSRRDLAGMTR